MVRRGARLRFGTMTEPAETCAADPAAVAARLLKDDWPKSLDELEKRKADRR